MPIVVPAPKDPTVTTKEGNEQSGIMTPTNTSAEVRTLTPGSTGYMSAEERLQKEKEGYSPNKIEVVNNGMDELTSINSKQTDQLVEMNQSMKRLVNIFNSTSVGATGGQMANTKTTRTGNANSTDYWDAPFSSGNDSVLHQTINQSGVG